MLKVPDVDEQQGPNPRRVAEEKNKCQADQNRTIIKLAAIVYFFAGSVYGYELNGAIASFKL